MGDPSLAAPRARHSGDNLWFNCPGCGWPHRVTVGPGGWTWNGSVEQPTLTPSVLCRGVQRCHSFVTDGRIHFLSDCSHALAGQTVDLPPWNMENTDG